MFLFPPYLQMIAILLLSGILEISFEIIATLR